MLNGLFLSISKYIIIARGDMQRSVTKYLLIYSDVNDFKYRSFYVRYVTKRTNTFSMIHENVYS